MSFLRTCIKAKRVFDSCTSQIAEENAIIFINDTVPPDPAAPLVFISAKSINNCSIENLSIVRLNERPRCARIQCDVNVPLEVTFIDAEGVECKGASLITVHEDVVMHIPRQSIIPFSVESVTSVVCPDGKYLGNYQFSVTECITIILEVVAEVQLLMPCYGYCSIPSAQNFNREACAEINELPLFPRS